MKVKTARKEKRVAEKKPRTIDEIIGDIEVTREKEQSLLTELNEYRTKINSFFGTPTPTASTGEKKTRKPKTCSNCGLPGHIAKTCTNAPKAATA